MYEQDEAPAYRRGLWMVLWFIVIVAVLWTLLWLIFFRHPSPKATTLHGSSTSQNHGGGQSASGSSSSPKKDSNSSSSSASGGTSNTSGATSDQLANVGAGNILVPFTMAGIAGTVLYHVRLRRKLQS